MSKEFKIDKKFFRKWVKALRRGKYLQVTSELKGKTDDGKVGYCCLGVACVLRAKETEKNVANYCYEYGSIDSAGLVGKWLLPIEKQNQLAQMNDKKVPFKAIADYIETTYL